MNNFLFICKASYTIGLGHLMRSKALALNFMSEGVEITFLVIGPNSLHNLIDLEISKCIFFKTEDEIINHLDNRAYKTIILDLLSLENITFQKIKSNSKNVISISPIFNFNSQVNAIFSRTKYSTDNNHKAENFIGGLEYTIINSKIAKQNKNIFIKNLNQESINIGIAMGGGDAANRTLSIIKELKNVKANCVIWAMLGEGYKHSLDDIIEAIEADSKHEVILAKNNRSMWQLLGNCSFVITTSGITSYEAVYVGIPTITFYENENQYFLIKELLEKNLAINGGIFKNNSVQKLSKIIDGLLKDRNILLKMHLASKNLISKKAGNRIFKKIELLHE